MLLTSYCSNYYQLKMVKILLNKKQSLFFVWPRLSLIGQLPLRELQLATLKLIIFFGIEIIIETVGIFTASKHDYGMNTRIITHFLVEWPSDCIRNQFCF